MQTVKRFLIPVLLLVLIPVAAAQPGTLLNVEDTGVYAPGQVDGQVAGRFRNNGETAPQAETAVHTYLIQFESTWPDGEPAPITAQLYVPEQPADPQHLLVFGPGSTGLVEMCAPSRQFVDNRSFDTYTAYTLAYAGQGSFAIVPNYMGFFDEGVIQPYFDKVAEGRVMLDAIRAATGVLRELGVVADEGQLPAFVAGYSQGGHAAFAAADLHGEYAPETNLLGVVGFGPSTIMSNLFLEFTYVSPWVIHAANAFSPELLDPAQLLVEPYLSNLSSDAERLCILEAQQYYPGSPDALFTPAFVAALRNGTLEQEFPAVAQFFARNDAGLAGHGFPAIILQGVDDPVVHLDSQDEFVRGLCERDSAVRYPNYLRTRHETRYIGFRDALEWMKSLAGGAPAPSDCELVID